jgi:aconitate hydratase
MRVRLKPDTTYMTANTFGTRTEIRVGGQPVQIYSLPALAKAGFAGVSRLPYSMKILLENLLRREDNAFVKGDDIAALANWNPTAPTEKEISFMPARVLLQDFTGVPCVVDLAAMRDAIVALGGNPDRVNPVQPVELVIDHSVQVDYFGRADAFSLNAELEFTRNRERYAFLRWGQRAFNNFQVVPPDTGIVHQVNIEYLARVVFSQTVGGTTMAFPDTLVGTDSPHHDGERAGGGRLGRRRHRGRGGDARPADLDVDSARCWLPAHRRHAAGCDGN